ncbi:MBL fold metallo-hydrolase [Pseudoalteromonas carrageenovora]|uniref:MBL fold metallo-hydrolase n=1 Tax=Pseudoalteromonas carrageenovora IAM 12662 TaxID=1314868 RepID=A0A2K4X624_PSEVC|nr:MBL fold metallo-hydrolase [Pseudoalteromonas carrageenovora]MBE0381935.1 metallo-beta-lactamase family protein [Pseudoalteromonas carrageenovora IAM 12662]QBJ70680.1 MBL fold metallo-hydrolase [Pseudoalteromonas carrageenovora]GEB69763.1 MBL fold hydrolase [Pseudoalteromonas carrageenovora]SOU39743.1 MBL fold metallo-hydrolase [Pseudoalteromonas carrageenovora IAM 12662]
MQILHHGAVNGVTGSCHELIINNKASVLIDCGLFQGEDSKDDLSIEFNITRVTALIVTHCHIDHVGRIPYLLAAGFKGPIFTTLASASLLPLVIEDALKVGVTRNPKIINACLSLLNKRITPVDFKTWFNLPVKGSNTAKAKFQRAGHILGSAYVEIDITNKSKNKHRVVFSGDLGAPYTPLLPSPKAPYKADTLVIESTYGDKNHQGRKERTHTLKKVIEGAIADNGVVLVPAFSIGRTQELLYELEQLIYKSAKNSKWRDLHIILDSPMAATFTEQYKNFKHMWDSEAKRKVAKGRHPLDFKNLTTVDSHAEHMAIINYLDSRQTPAIILAASGMCSGGRIVNYLERFLSDATTDVLFVGYQGRGTLGRDIQKYGPRNGYVFINDTRINIHAKIHTISGYSAHADQKGLIKFVTGMRKKPSHIKIVHGDDEAKNALATKYKEVLGSEVKIEIGKG